MIELGNIYVKDIGEKVQLICPIKLSASAINKWCSNIANIEKKMKNRYRTDFINDEYEFELWYEVDKKYKSALCWERTDAFLVAILYFALVAG